MKTRTSTIVFLIAIASLVWYYHLDPGGTIISDIPNDPNITEGWPWLVGALGLVLLPVGLLMRQNENERQHDKKRRNAKLQLSANRRQRNADQIRVRWSAETGIPQYPR